MSPRKRRIIGVQSVKVMIEERKWRKCSVQRSRPTTTIFDEWRFGVSGGNFSVAALLQVRRSFTAGGPEVPSWPRTPPESAGHRQTVQYDMSTADHYHPCIRKSCVAKMCIASRHPRASCEHRQKVKEEKRQRGDLRLGRLETLRHRERACKCIHRKGSLPTTSLLQRECHPVLAQSITARLATSKIMLV